MKLIAIFTRKVDQEIGLFFLLSSFLVWIWRYFKWLIRKLVKLWLWACLIVLLAEWSGNVGTDAPKSRIIYSDNSKNLIESFKIEAPKMKDPVEGWQLPPAWVPKEN